MQLMDIEDPVEDQKGYVYERVHVEQYIKQKQAAGVREVQCPASGELSAIVHGLCGLHPGTDHETALCADTMFVMQPQTISLP